MYLICISDKRVRVSFHMHMYKIVCISIYMHMYKRVYTCVSLYTYTRRAKGPLYYGGEPIYLTGANRFIYFCGSI